MNRTDSRAELVEFQAAIRERYDFHIDAFRRGDAHGLVKGFFTEDAVWTGPGFPDAVGHQQIMAMFSAVVGTQTVSVTSEHTAVRGSVGWDIAAYPVVPNNPDLPPFTFRPLFVWETQAEGWRCKAVCSFLR
ncbi:DUF4440 domain-containing protein [Paraburkholderia sp. EG286B]|uniref:YybH family protein n=1 Tax=Paraburkholderia sp. EG286B TaxID=3237011 RepID=UPI0034D35EBD